MKLNSTIKFTKIPFASQVDLVLKNEKKNIILIGAGGHATSCIDVIETTNKFKIIGLIDKKKKLS